MRTFVALGTLSLRMHEYDVTLKSVLQRSSGTVLRRLTGLSVKRWHNVELPAVQNRRVDMLGETANGRCCTSNCKAPTGRIWLCGCLGIRLRSIANSGASRNKWCSMSGRHRCG